MRFFLFAILLCAFFVDSALAQPVGPSVSSPYDSHDKEKAKKDAAEKERLEQERLKKEKLERDRLERERLEQERLEKEKTEKIRRGEKGNRGSQIKTDKAGSRSVISREFIEAEPEGKLEDLSVSMVQINEPASEDPPQASVFPLLKGASNVCVHPGDVMALTGENLNSLPRLQPALLNDNQVFPLRVLGASYQQLMVSVPDNVILYERQQYQLILLSNKNRNKISSRTNVYIDLCQYETPLVEDDEVLNNIEPEEILVLANSGAEADAVNQYVQQYGNTIRRHELLSLDVVMLVLNVEAGDVADIIQELRQLFPDATVDYNTHYAPVAEPRVYAPSKLKWPTEGHCLQKLDTLLVGLIDGLVETSHSAFAGRSIRTKNFIPDQVPDQGHGTAIASILIGSDGDAGFSGLVPEITLFSAVVLRVSGNDKRVATAEAVIRSIDWLMQNKVRLINISLAGSRENHVLTNALERSIDKGAIIFAAVGNSGSSAAPSYPAAIQNVIAVTAVDAVDRIYHEANQGGYVDFSAPGVDIWVAEIDQGGSNGHNHGAYRSGTSYGSPYAVASAAQILAKNPSLSRDILYRSMKASVKDLGAAGRDSVFGWGLVQAKPCSE